MRRMEEEMRTASMQLLRKATVTGMQGGVTADRR